MVSVADSERGLFHVDAEERDDGRRGGWEDSSGPEPRCAERVLDVRRADGCEQDQRPFEGVLAPDGADHFDPLSCVAARQIPGLAVLNVPLGDGTRKLWWRVESDVDPSRTERVRFKDRDGERGTIGAEPVHSEAPGTCS